MKNGNSVFKDILREVNICVLRFSGVIFLPSINNGQVNEDMTQNVSVKASISLKIVKMSLNIFSKLL